MGLPLALATLLALQSTPPEGYTPLFNGKDLAGWKADEEAKKHWTVKEGVLDYDGRNKDLWTEKSFADFTLVLSWRWSGKPTFENHPVFDADGNEIKGKTERMLDGGDSGVFLRGYRKAQANLFCYPCGSGEVWEYRTDPKMPADVRRACMPKKRADKPVGEWNRMKIVLRGERLTVFVNDEEVISEARLPGIPAGGPIGLQHEFGTVQFRDLFIKEDDPSLPRVPPDWTIEVVAEAPKIQHPTVVCCAPDGRVFVGEDPMDIRVKADQELGRVLCFHPDGKVTVFAEKLHAVFGLLYLDGKLYVHHAPRLSLFTDDNGVGKDRVDLLECTNPKPWALDWNDHVPANLHLAMDGTLYMAVGDKGLYGCVGRDGKEVRLHGGGIVRMRPDATGLEVYCSGTRNILDVAINAEDELFSYDNTDEKDWWGRVTHMVDGGYYAYPWDHKPRRPWTLWMMHDTGAGAATAALAYTGDALPEGYRGNLFLADFGKREVLRLRIARAGATYTVLGQEKFIHDGPPDFRPVGLAVAPDGLSFYVGDWRHRDIKANVVVGRLLKVTYTGKSAAAPTPAWYVPAATGKPFEATNADLVAGLAHPSRDVRMVAQRRLVDRKAVKELEAALPNPHAIWALEGSSPALLAAAKARDLQAIRALGERRVREARGILEPLLKDADGAVRFRAATALGRIGDAAAVPALLEALPDKDFFARFAVFTALRRIGAWEAVSKGLEGDFEGTLFAMREAYDVANVAALAAAIRRADLKPAAREAAVETLAGLHKKFPEWKGEWWAYHPVDLPRPVKTAAWEGTAAVLEALRGALDDPEPVVRRVAVRSLREAKDVASAPRLRELFRRETETVVKSSILFALGVFRDAAAGDLVAGILADPVKNKELLGDAVATAEEIGAREPLAKFLATRPSDPELLTAAIEAAGKLKAAEAADSLVLSLKHEDAGVRAAALAALGKIGGDRAVEAVVPLVEDKDPATRKAAVAALGSFKNVKAIPALLSAFVGGELKFDAAQALARTPDLRALDAYLYGIGTQNQPLRDACRRAVAALGKEALPAVEKKLEISALSPLMVSELQQVYRAEKGSPLLKVQVRKVDPEVYFDFALKNAGDAARGRRLFTDAQGVACIRCHRVGDLGADVGPNLSGVGLQYVRKDLAESVLYPSRKIREGYQQTIVATSDGFIVAGFVKAESAELLTLVDAEGTKHEIPKSGIRNRKASDVSIMPEGLNTGMSLQDFADLVSFLESLREKPR